MSEHNGTELDDKGTLASRRMASYRLLADCYYPPDNKLLEKLRSASQWDEGKYSSLAAIIEGEEDLKALAVDAAKLFIGPFELLAPPYGSVYLENSRVVMGESTIDAEKLYIDEGLNLELKEAPDHITIELEFMSYLNFLQVEALNASNMESAQLYRKKQLAFLDDHLGRWVFKFTENITTFSHTEFYKNVAVLTDALIQADIG